MIGITIAGQPTSRIGFGCGRLVGGAGMRSSVALVETALTLGIRHFDTAPSYGLGTSEDVLGTVLAGQQDVTIITKVGQPRPTKSGGKALARQVLRPLLAWAPSIRANLAIRANGNAATLFQPSLMRASIEDSLRRLRRDKVAAILLHEIAPNEMNSLVAEEIGGWLNQGFANAVGSGTGKALVDLVAFGDVAQYMWQPGLIPDQPASRVVHGVLRHYPQPASYTARQVQLLRELGRDPADPRAWVGAALTMALTEDARSILLVSSTKVSRLRMAIESIDWSIVSNCSIKNLEVMRKLLIN